jgi:hypothetical protein
MSAVRPSSPAAAASSITAPTPRMLNTLSLEMSLQGVEGRQIGGDSNTKAA